MLMIVVFVLVSTGLPLKYHNLAVSKYLFSLFGGNELRSEIHKIAALFLIFIFFYHCLYALVSEKGNKDFRLLLPNKKDFNDVLKMLFYYLGRNKEKPLFGRFNYWQKFHYLAIGFGCITMILSGCIIWLENFTLILFPKWIIDISMVIHSNNANLIFVLVILLHIYNVHLNPENFPFSRHWITGYLTEEEMKKFHQLEYEEIEKNKP